MRKCHFFCQLLESSLARINWIRAVDKKSVEQVISCQKCRAIACRAIAIRAVHPHSLLSTVFQIYLKNMAKKGQNMYTLKTQKYFPRNYIFGLYFICNQNTYSDSECIIFPYPFSSFFLAHIFSIWKCSR